MLRKTHMTIKWNILQTNEKWKRRTSFEIQQIKRNYKAKLVNGWYYMVWKKHNNGIQQKKRTKHQNLVNTEVTQWNIEHWTHKRDARFLFCFSCYFAKWSIVTHHFGCHFRLTRIGHTLKHCIPNTIITKITTLAMQTSDKFQGNCYGNKKFNELNINIDW